MKEGRSSEALHVNAAAVPTRLLTLFAALLGLSLAISKLQSRRTPNVCTLQLMETANTCIFQTRPSIEESVLTFSLIAWRGIWQQKCAKANKICEPTAQSDKPLPLRCMISLLDTSDELMMARAGRRLFPQCLS